MQLNQKAPDMVRGTTKALRRSLLAVSVALTLSGAVSAMDSVEAECDRYAASPYDPTRPDAMLGVAFADIDVARAEPACRAAWDKTGDVRFAFQLARALYQGDRTDEALPFYEAAVAGGHAEAISDLSQIKLAIAEEGAFALTREARDKGSPTALYNLAVMLRDGLGVEPDIAQSVALFEAAAAAGDAEAAYNIGVIFDEGEIVLRDLERARVHYEQAVAGGFGWAKVNLAYALLEDEGDGEALARAISLFRDAAENDGDINAGLELARLIQSGSEAEQAEAEGLVMAALRDRDFELGRFLQLAETGFTSSIISAVQEEIGAPISGTMDAKSLTALRKYYVE